MSGQAEPSEVDALWSALVGPRDLSDQPLDWYLHLTARQTLAEALVARTADERGEAVVEMLTGSSVRQVAARLGLSPGRVQQLADRGRRTLGG